MRTLVVAPHPDDEILGPGGTLLRRKSEGSTVGWLVITAMESSRIEDQGQIQARQKEIDNVRSGLGINQKDTWFFNYPTTQLDTIPMGELVAAISRVIRDFQPEEIFVLVWGDAHSDHRLISEAVGHVLNGFGTHSSNGF